MTRAFAGPGVGRRVRAAVGGALMAMALVVASASAATAIPPEPVATGPRLRAVPMPPSPVRPSVTVTTWPALSSAPAYAPVVYRGRVSPVTPAMLVRLEERTSAGTWVLRASAAPDTAGRFAVGYTMAAAGVRTFRWVVDPRRADLTPARGLPRVITVAPDGARPVWYSRMSTQKASLAALEASTRATLGVALVPLNTASSPAVIGSLTSGVAWSTAKVPLSVAALQHSDTTAIRADVSRAITTSDNAAADRLWRSLGTDAQAAAAVTGVLRDGGDATTTVPSTRLRAGYSVFGQTSWSLANQARFTAHLACLPKSAPVLTGMGQVTSSQRWGLGRLDAQLKGGWGPDATGRYTARQLGIVHLPAGDLALTITARPNDGTYASATAALDALARWVARGAYGAAPGSC